jgi:sulfur-oxidizing protein SoxA
LGLKAVAAIVCAGWIAAAVAAAQPVASGPDVAAGPGDPTRGRAIVRDPGRVSCLICHAMPIPEEPDHGAIGPPLDGIGSRMGTDELRRRIADPAAFASGSAMPSYRRTDGLVRVSARHLGQPIYSAQELEDVVAYLATLTQRVPPPVPPPPRTQDPAQAQGQASSGAAYLDAATRRLQEDDFLNPGMFAAEQGREVFRRVDGDRGMSCAACHDEAATRGMAAGYPRYEAARGGIVDLAAAIDAMRRDKMGAAPLGRDSEEMLALSAFLARQSRGLLRRIDADGPARPFLEAGRDFFFARRGQLDLSCAQCHDALAGAKLRGDTISQGQTDGFPVYRLSWRAMASPHRMFAWCNAALRAEPFEGGSDAYLALEFYLAWRGRDLPLDGPAVRR